MLEALKFVRRGVARRDYVPGLTHFKITNGRCTGYNGAIAMSAPVDIGFNIAPEADIFIKALDACEDVINLTMEGPTTLLVKSGSFRVTIPCLSLDQVPDVVPEGNRMQPQESILKAFEALTPFVGIDASRSWCMGILLLNASAYATNNIIVAEYWLGTTFPALVNIPATVIEEIVRVDEEMIAMQVSDSSVTFHYADGRWIKAALLALDWPNVPDLMAKTWDMSKLLPIPKELRAACSKLSTLAEKGGAPIYFRGTDVSNRPKGNNTGAIFDLVGIPDKGCFHSSHLNTILAYAEQADFEAYPLPIPFAGGRLRGVMLGMAS